MKEKPNLIVPMLAIVFVLLILPIGSVILLNYKLSGKFTFDTWEILEELEQREDEEQYRKVAEHCDFMITGSRYGYEC